VGRNSGNFGTFVTNPKFGDLGTNHALNLGTKPHQSLETFLVDFKQSLFKNTFPEFEKKKKVLCDF